MERRKFRRIEFKTPAFIEHDHKVTFGEVENVSTSGAFIRTQGNFSATDRILASFYFLEGGATISVTVPGTIVRTVDGGVGVHSPQIDIYTLMHLEHLLLFNKGDSKRLSEEFYEYLNGKFESRV
ncbi:MAG TPA: PilZ domain-containing protein [Geobacteraceae bacterium]